jgi:hypothetical protein
LSIALGVLGNDLKILDQYSVKRYIKDGLIHPNYQLLKQSGPRTNLIKAALLVEHGGIWIDADTVVLRHFNDLPWDRDLMYMKWSTGPQRILTGYIGARKDSPIAYRWLQEANRMIEDVSKTATGDYWLVLGERVLTPIVANMGGDLQEIPLSTFLPVDLSKPNGATAFVGTSEWRDYITPHTLAFGLNHSWLVDKHAALMLMWDRQNSPIMIHRLLQQEE